MFSPARHGRSVSLAAAVLLFCAVPSVASPAAEDKRAPAIEQSIASNMPAVPAITAVAPASILNDAAQTRPIDVLVPHAGPRGFEAPSLRRSMYVSFAALQAFDAISTRKALSAGGHEANPGMTRIVNNTAALFAVKAGTAAATTYFAERLAKNHPRRATIVMAVLNVAYAGIVLHNYRVAGAR